jgi:hypothetical protein
MWIGAKFENCLRLFVEGERESIWRRNEESLSGG